MVIKNILIISYHTRLWDIYLLDFYKGSTIFKSYPFYSLDLLPYYAASYSNFFKRDACVRNLVET